MTPAKPVNPSDTTRVTPSLPEEDAKARAAVRARLDHVAAHPALIDVRVRDGVALLSGPVLEREVGPLLNAARRTPGIRLATHSFDVLSPESEAARHLPDDRFGYQPEFLIGRWAPWLRVLGGLAGLSLFARGLRRKDAPGVAAAGVGALLLSRAVTNRDVTHLIGSLILPVIRLRRTIDVSAPVEDVYGFWSVFANFPRFMSYIREVRVNDSGGLRWVADAPGGSRLRWDTTVPQLALDKKIGWKSVPGSLIATEGLIRFEALETDRTRVYVELSYAPPAGALGYAVGHLLGFDPRARIDEDLELMRLLVELSRR